MSEFTAVGPALDQTTLLPTALRVEPRLPLLNTPNSCFADSETGGELSLRFGGRAYLLCHRGRHFRVMDADVFRPRNQAKMAGVHTAGVLAQVMKLLARRYLTHGLFVENSMGEPPSGKGISALIGSAKPLPARCDEPAVSLLESLRTSVSCVAWHVSRVFAFANPTRGSCLLGNRGYLTASTLTQSVHRPTSGSRWPNPIGGRCWT